MPIQCRFNTSRFLTDCRQKNARSDMTRLTDRDWDIAWLQTHIVGRSFFHSIRSIERIYTFVTIRSISIDGGAGQRDIITRHVAKLFLLSHFYCRHIHTYTIRVYIERKSWKVQLSDRSFFTLIHCPAFHIPSVAGHLCHFETMQQARELRAVHSSTY